MDSPNVSIEWFRIKYIITESEHYQWFTQYVKCVLNVKGTMSNVMVTGESVQLPPSIFSHVDALSYMGRLQKLPTHTIVRRIYTQLFRLHSYSFHIWVTEVFGLSKGYGINLVEINSRNLRLECKREVTTHFDTQNLLKPQFFGLFLFACMAYISSCILV